MAGTIDPGADIGHVHLKVSDLDRRFNAASIAGNMLEIQSLNYDLGQVQNEEWRELIDRLAVLHPGEEEGEASRNMINALIVLARRAGVVRTLKGKTLSTAPVLLALEGPKLFQESVIRCDTVYLEAIRALPEPFDVEEAARAIYDQVSYAPYLRQLLARMDAAQAG